MLFTSLFITKSKLHAQAVNVQDSLALVDLYNSTNGPGWFIQFNWLTGPVDKWWGITVTNSRVTVVALNFNYLTGSIPPEIGNLANLTYLDLSGNQLSGNIPPELGNLTNLTYLDLFGNQLSGNIPPDLGNLGNLQTMDLSVNQLTGNIPTKLGNLANLRTLSLHHNQLSGSIPHKLGNLSNLIHLFLFDNQLSGNIPTELGSLGNLSMMSLYDNQLSGSIPSQLGNLTKLSILILFNNELSGSIPPELGNLATDLSLWIDYNHFTFNGMELISSRYTNAKYSPQSNITVNQNENALFVSAGGTLSNNTFKWFMIGQNDSTVIIGDSVFHPLQNGKYYATVTNSICNKLTLYTDTIDYAGVLPVTIVNPKAYQKNEIIKVDWTSLTELNIARYEVQRSNNVTDFKAIGSVLGSGNGTANNYSFDDIKPLKGTNYYRLKIYDKDGKNTYSKILSVNFNGGNITLIYPNPAKNVLYIKTSSVASFDLINQSGKILISKIINNSGSMNISGVVAGLYYLRNNNTGVVEKVIISK